MNLAPGTRLEAGAGSAYVVGEFLPGEFLQPWRHARKIFRNYRHADRSLFEASNEESLDVLIRGPGSSVEELRFELESIYALAEADWFLEPIDVIDAEGGPLLVLSDPHATPIAARGAVLEEAIAMHRLLSDHGLVAESFSPSEYLVDRDGRLVFLGTDRLVRIPPGEMKRALEGLAGRWDAFVQSLG